MEKNAKSFKGLQVGCEVVGGGGQSGVCLCIVFTEHCEALLYYALYGYEGFEVWAGLTG